ncbi:lipoate--protein ligase family protein [Salisediminibacterium halotolerans]|uniref:Lipoate-protein ligase A n=1 Tax=Salisediminibacterium halotolerans TaxID=517425 RepID=A0A1H9UI15_9BACI|nr:lipoate--protein ligase family protein [Salisediminibacterium haloalkalitolerans]SES09076.1 lipoate-protein ligase A [Salisediminibacterium haloalkalitolerans]
MSETWYYLESYSEDAARNMAIDEWLMTKVGAGDSKPVLRFYTWKPKALSLGYFQKTDGKIDLDAVQASGADIVRRLTGGRAVLHDHELTYSVILPDTHPNMPTSVTESYKILSQGLMEGYRNLGIDAELAEDRPEGKPDNSAVCFEEPSWYELLASGKKAAGSAQVRKKGALLQHGSVPITMNIEELYDMFMYRTERAKEKMRESFREKATTIADELGRTPDMEEVAAAFYSGFEKGLNVKLEPIELSKEDQDQIKRLESSYQFSPAPSVSYLT